MTDTTKNYLAIVRVGFGDMGSYGRANSPHKAVKLARKYASKDFGLTPKPRRFEVYDVTGHGELCWDDSPGVVFDAKNGERIERLEIVNA